MQLQVPIVSWSPSAMWEEIETLDFVSHKFSASNLKKSIYMQMIIFLIKIFSGFIPWSLFFFHKIIHFHLHHPMKWDEMRESIPYSITKFSKNFLVFFSIYFFGFYFIFVFVFGDTLKIKLLIWFKNKILFFLPVEELKITIRKSFENIKNTSEW